MKKRLLIVLAALCLAGCASGPRTHYAWNNYSNHLYDYQAQKIDNAQMLQSLLEAVEEAQKRNVRLAPGLYAEIGTMYIRMNQPAEAPKYYRLEAATWPESAGFMTTIADAIERNLAKQGENK